jgi:hypothetical protein
VYITLGLDREPIARTEISQAESWYRDAQVDIGRHVVPARLRSLPASRLHLLLMLALTFSTGIIVDALGYLGLDPGLHREHDGQRRRPPDSAGWR